MDYKLYFEPICKTSKKFKLADCGKIDVSTLCTTPRTSKTEKGSHLSGLYTEQYCDVFFVKDGKEMIYKDLSSDINYKNTRGWAEVITSKLAKQLGIRCAECEFAHDGNNSHGIVSYNFLEENQKLVPGYEILDYTYSDFFNHTLQYYSYALDNLQKEGYIVNKNQIIFDLYKIIVFDFLTCQDDRHSSNISFVYTTLPSGKIEITLAPLYDNEFAFSFMHEIKDIRNISYKTFTNENLAPMRFGIKNVYNDSCYTPYECCVKEAKEIISFAKKDEKYKTFLINVVKKLDIFKAYARLDIEGIKMDMEHLAWYDKCIESKKYILQKVLSQEKTDNDLISLGEDLEQSR